MRHAHDQDARHLLVRTISTIILYNYRLTFDLINRRNATVELRFVPEPTPTAITIMSATLTVSRPAIFGGVISLSLASNRVEMVVLPPASVPQFAFALKYITLDGRARQTIHLRASSAAEYAEWKQALGVAVEEPVLAVEQSVATPSADRDSALWESELALDQESNVPTTSDLESMGEDANFEVEQGAGALEADTRATDVTGNEESLDLPACKTAEAVPSRWTDWDDSYGSSTGHVDWRSYLPTDTGDDWCMRVEDGAATFDIQSKATIRAVAGHPIFSFLRGNCLPAFTIFSNMKPRFAVSRHEYTPTAAPTLSAQHWLTDEDTAPSSGASTIDAEVTSDDYDGQEDGKSNVKEMIAFFEAQIAKFKVEAERRRSSTRSAVERDGVDRISTCWELLDASPSTRGARDRCTSWLVTPESSLCQRRCHRAYLVHCELDRLLNDVMP